MKTHKITELQIKAFEKHLQKEERSRGTIEKYLRDVRRFSVCLGEGTASKEAVVRWKQKLIEDNYRPSTINSILSALNSFFSFVGWRECCVRYLRIQRQLFRSQERELSREEYERLVETAQCLGKNRLALLLQTICATGIRVSEVKYITVEAVQTGRTEISLKGKIRTILLPGKLCRKLEKYAKRQKIASGEIFLTRSGRGISRRQIWAEMKALCEKAEVNPEKVFPHNLRHVFARAFYRVCRDIAKLADVLGHSSIETTRLYLVSTGVEHARQLEQLRLIL